MADYFKFMRCPKCNAVITEHVNTNMALNDASCPCGYEYVETESNVRRDDGTTTEAEIEEFYNAARPKDEAESDQWAEEYYSDLMSVPDKELAQWAQDYKTKRLASGATTHKEFEAKQNEGPKVIAEDEFVPFSVAVDKPLSVIDVQTNWYDTPNREGGRWVLRFRLLITGSAEIDFYLMVSEMKAVLASLNHEDQKRQPRGSNKVWWAYETTNGEDYSFGGSTVKDVPICLYRDDHFSAYLPHWIGERMIVEINAKLKEIGE